MDDRIRVLCVDDEPDLLDITKLYLERSGELEVGISVSAERALDNSGIGSYDAIVSDYLMPGMDGIAFLRAVRERFGDIPFILFTGRGREDVVIRALNEGVDFYLQKGGDPKVQFAELVHKIRQGVRRRRAEKALREGEEKYRSIVETINDWIWETDLEGNHTYSNSAVERMLGYTADEIVGSSSFSHIHPDDVSRVRDLIAESTREKLSDPYTTMIRWLHRDGSGRLFESAIIPMVNGDGEITGFRGIDRDITERINSEEALRESEKRYRALFENANDAITVNGLSPDGMPSRFIDVNANACRLTEYTREELLSMTPLALDDPDTWEEARSCMRTLMEKGHHVFERTHLRKAAGLGLSLVREILSLTGISIRETGEEGAGACFEITVPAAGWRIAGQ
jgi:PAS domain S-box-containing protein